MTQKTSNGAVCCPSETGVQAPAAQRTFAPRVDIVETEQALLLYADLPGVGPHDIDLSYEQGELTLRGKLQPRQGAGRAVFSEFDCGDFQRVFQLSDLIDVTRIDAEFKNGVLTVRLPKQEQAKPKQVPIRVQA